MAQAELDDVLSESETAQMELKPARPRRLSVPEVDALDLEPHPSDVPRVLGRHRSPPPPQPPPQRPSTCFCWEKLKIFQQSRFNAVLQTVVTILSLIAYVPETYTQKPDNGPGWDDEAILYCVLDVTFTSVFVVDFVGACAVAKHWTSYAFSTEGIFDMLAILPVIRWFLVGEDVVNVLAVFRTLKILRILRLKRLLRHEIKTSRTVVQDNAVQDQIFTLVFSIFAFVFITTGLINTLSTQAPNDFGFNNNLTTNNSLEFDQSLYFVVVSFTTVGYGDIAPSDVASRLFVTFMIALAFAVFPYQVSSVVAAVNRRSATSGSMAKQKKTHVVVTGTLTISNCLHFLRELYNEDHRGDAKRVQQVVLMASEASEVAEMEKLVACHPRKDWLLLLQGDSLNAQDLKRARASEAAAIFLLLDQQSSDLELEDAKSVMRAKGLRTLNALSHVQVIVQLVRLDSLDLVLQLPNTHATCMDEVRLSLLARSCLTPGVSTLVGNLIASTSEFSEEDDSAHEVMEAAAERPWTEQYKHGAQHEIYRVVLTDWPPDQTLLFHNALEHLYASLGILMVGVVRTDSAGKEHVTVNPPPRTEVAPGDTVLVAARSARSANTAKTWSMEDSVLSEICSPRHTEGWFRTGAQHSRSDTTDFMKNTLRHTLLELRTPRATCLSGMPSPPRHRSSLDQRNRESTATEDRDAATWDAMAMLSAELTTRTRAAPEEVARRVAVQLEAVAEAARSPDEIHHHVLILNSRVVSSVAFLILELRKIYGRSKLSSLIITIVQPNEHTLKELTRRLKSLGMRCTHDPHSWRGGEIRLIHGSPLAKVELEEAGIGVATSVVILTQAGVSFASGERRKDSEYLLDAEGLMIASRVHSMCSGTEDAPHVLLELLHTDNSRMVDGLVSYGESEFESSLYAAGKIMFTSVHDALVCQTYFNPHISAVFHAMLGRGNLRIHDSAQYVDAHQLMQLDVPEEYIGFPYADLLSDLALHRHIALGLYRQAGTSGSPTAFVATNPTTDTRLTEGDRMFVLICASSYRDSALIRSTSE